MAATVAWTGSYAVTSPFCIDGALFVASATSGQLLRLGDDNELSVVLDTNGQPAAAAVDPSTNDVFIADASRQAIVKTEGGSLAAEDSGSSTQLAQFLDQFEGQNLRGPTGIAFDAQGELYFSDAGPLGDTGLHNPRGVVYRTVQGRQQVVALCPPTLAHPAGIACGTSGCVYVCETSANRVLRFAPKPAGVLHASVFVQLAGGFGPSAVAVHDATQDIYIAKYDFAGCSSEGAVVIYTSAGVEKGTIPLPGCEVTGLCFDGNTLYVTEGHTIYRVEVPRT